MPAAGAVAAWRRPAGIRKIVADPWLFGIYLLITLSVVVFAVIPILSVLRQAACPRRRRPDLRLGCAGRPVADPFERVRRVVVSHGAFDYEGSALAALEWHAAA